MTKYYAGLVLQKAIFDRLSRDLSYGIYDTPPDNLKKPYVTIGDETVIDYYAKTFQGGELSCTIHFFSRYRGSQEVKTMIAEAIEALTKTEDPLTVAGYGVLDLNKDFIQVFDESEEIKHGILRIRARLVKRD